MRTCLKNKLKAKGLRESLKWGSSCLGSVRSEFNPQHLKKKNKDKQKKLGASGCQQLTPVILGTQEAEIRRITI
jgi:hypothetical protein